MSAVPEKWLTLSNAMRVWHDIALHPETHPDLHRHAAEVLNAQANEVTRMGQRLKATERAIYDGRLCPAHFEAWADQIEQEQGYKGSELTCLLRRLAALAAGGQDDRP